MRYFYHRIKHLIWLYFDLKEHKKQKRIVDFSIRWNSYQVVVQPVKSCEYIHIDYKIGEAE